MICGVDIQFMRIPDMVAALAETTGHFALTRIRTKMLNDPVGRQILE